MDTAALVKLAEEALARATVEYVKDKASCLKKGKVRIVKTGEIGTFFWSAAMPRIAGHKWTHAVAMSDERDANGRYKNVRWLDVSEIEMAEVDTTSDHAKDCIERRAVSILDQLREQSR